MADDVTHLDLVVPGSEEKERQANELFDPASPAITFGRRALTTVTLTWGWYGGPFLTDAGTIVNIANGSALLPASSTSYVEANATTGAVTNNVVGFTAGRIPLYVVVTNATTITGYTDKRVLSMHSPISARGAVALTDATPVVINADTTDFGFLTTLSQDSTIANPTGTPQQKWKLMIRIKSTAARALTWGSQYRGSVDLALPAATSGGSLTDYYGFVWNAEDSKWDYLAKNFGF